MQQTDTEKTNLSYFCFGFRLSHSQPNATKYHVTFLKKYKPLFQFEYVEIRMSCNRKKDEACVTDVT